jgi:hypothetical protein
MTKFLNGIMLLVVSLVLVGCATTIRNHPTALLKEVLTFSQIHQGDFQDLRLLSQPNQRLRIGEIVETNAKTVKTLLFANTAQVTLMPNTRVKIRSDGIKLLTNQSVQSQLFIKHDFSQPREFFLTETQHIKVMPTGTKYSIKAFQQNVSIEVFEGSTQLFSNTQSWEYKLVNTHETASVRGKNVPVTQPMTVAEITKLIHPITQVERVIVASSTTPALSMPIPLPPPPVIKQRAFPPPTPAQIKKWWGINESYSLGKVKSIKLLSGETAYLAYVEFENRGRWFNHVGILIRPTLKKVKEIHSSGFHNNFKVMDLDNNNISEIELHLGGLWAQGDRPAFLNLIYFKDWEVVLLHEIDYEWSDINDPYDGTCGGYDGGVKLLEDECIKEKVNWSYQYLDNDGILELIEKKSKEQFYLDWNNVTKKYKKRNLKKKTTVNYFTLKNLKLIPFKPSVETGTVKGSWKAKKSDAMLVAEATKGKLTKTEGEYFDELCGTVHYDTEIIDLNNDGQPEVFTNLHGTCMGGRTGVYMKLYIKNASGHWIRQFGFPGLYKILKTKNKGYPDIEIGGPGFCFPVWRWNGQRYGLHKKCPL